MLSHRPLSVFNMDALPFAIGPFANAALLDPWGLTEALSLTSDDLSVHAERPLTLGLLEDVAAEMKNAPLSSVIASQNFVKIADAFCEIDPDIFHRSVAAVCVRRNIVLFDTGAAARQMAMNVLQEIALSLCVFGALARGGDDFRSAEIYLCRARELRPDDPKVAKEILLLAESYFNSGNFQKVSELLESVSECLGHMETQNVRYYCAFLSKLGRSYAELKEWKKAEKIFAKAVFIVDSHLPDQNLLMAKLLYCLAHVRSWLENYPQAEANCKRGLDLLEQMEEVDAETLICQLHQMGVIHGNLGHWDIAEQTLRRALDAAKKAYGQCDARRIILFETLRDLLTDAGKKDQAKAVEAELRRLRSMS